jgi:uncharacterized coiled-coil protein SlyX
MSAQPPSANPNPENPATPPASSEEGGNKVPETIPYERFQEKVGEVNALKENVTELEQRFAHQQQLIQNLTLQAQQQAAPAVSSDDEFVDPVAQEVSTMKSQLEQVLNQFSSLQYERTKESVVNEAIAQYPVMKDEFIQNGVLAQAERIVEQLHQQGRAVDGRTAVMQAAKLAQERYGKPTSQPADLPELEGNNSPEVQPAPEDEYKKAVESGDPVKIAAAKMQRIRNKSK